MNSLSLLPLLLATACFAAPSQINTPGVPANSTGPLPPGLNPPTTQPTFATVAVGTYNYSCSESGTFGPGVPLANVFDISALFLLPEFAKIQTDTFTLWNGSPNTDALDPDVASAIINKFGIELLGTYYASGAGGLMVDFTKATNDPNKFLNAKVTADVSSPDDAANDFDWLEMTSSSGSLAKTTLQFHTVGGQKPLGNSCDPSNPGENIKFTAQLWGF